jgi:UTP:GlnB (protein PII) uridylyltransferase
MTSDPTRAIVRTIADRASRFKSPGTLKVDITVTWADKCATLRNLWTAKPNELYRTLKRITSVKTVEITFVR